MVNFWLIFAWLMMDVDSCCESSQPLGMTTDVFVITKAWCYEPSRTHWTIPYPRLTIQAKPSSRAVNLTSRNRQPVAIDVRLLVRSEQRSGLKSTNPVASHRNGSGPSQVKHTWFPSNGTNFVSRSKYHLDQHQLLQT